MSIQDNITKTVLSIPAQAAAFAGQAQATAAALISQIADLDLDDVQKKFESDAKALPGQAGAMYDEAVKRLKDVDVEELFDGIEDKIEDKLEDLAEDVKELVVMLAAVARKAAT
ncbi:hypothetical protein, partial [Mumia zhuanghuii]